MICCAWSDSALRATGSVVVSVWLYSSSNVHFPEASRAQYPLSLSSVTIPWHVWTMRNSDVSVIGVQTQSQSHTSQSNRYQRLYICAPFSSSRVNWMPAFWASAMTPRAAVSHHGSVLKVENRKLSGCVFPALHRGNSVPV